MRVCNILCFASTGTDIDNGLNGFSIICCSQNSFNRLCKHVDLAIIVHSSHKRHLEQLNRIGKVSFVDVF